MGQTTSFNSMIYPTRSAIHTILRALLVLKADIYRLLIFNLCDKV